MSKKIPFVTKEQLEKIVSQYPTPFHLYDEAGIRRTARLVNKAFSWNKGFKEYFAVKATPNPYLLQILREEGCGADCSSYTELLMSDAVGFKESEIMFSSNATPAEDFKLARKLNVNINLDDITHIDFLEKVADIPETVCCRYNPGGHFAIANNIMDNPGDAKYGMTHEQIIEAYKILKSKGVKNFGIHAFLASNTVTNEYYPELARILFELAVELKEKTGAHISFINLSGGIGIAYKPEQQDNDVLAIGEGVRKVFEEVLVPAGMGDVKLFTELGRYMLAPNGALVTTAIHQKHIYKEYIGCDACAANLMRPAIYGSYHHISVMGTTALVSWFSVIDEINIPIEISAIPIKRFPRYPPIVVQISMLALNSKSINGKTMVAANAIIITLVAARNLPSTTSDNLIGAVSIS